MPLYGLIRPNNGLLSRLVHAARRVPPTSNFPRRYSRVLAVHPVGIDIAGRLPTAVFIRIQTHFFAFLPIPRILELRERVTERWVRGEAPLYGVLLQNPFAAALISNGSASLVDRVGKRATLGQCGP